MECSKASQEFVDNKTHKSTARQPQKMEKQRDHLGLAGFCSQSFTTKSLIESSQCIKDPTVNTARQEGCQPGFCANKRAACLEGSWFIYGHVWFIHAVPKPETPRLSSLRQHQRPGQKRGCFPLGLFTSRECGASPGPGFGNPAPCAAPAPSPAARPVSFVLAISC